MEQIKEEKYLDTVQDCETLKYTPMKNDPEDKNSMSVCNPMNVKESDQQEFVSEAFTILNKLCDLKMEEKTNVSDSKSAELSKSLYSDTSNRKQKLLMEAEYEFLIINACDILSRLLDRSPDCDQLKCRNKHSSKTKPKTLKGRHLKEFYKAEECINIAGLNESIELKSLDLKSFDTQSSKDRECNLYDSNIIKDWEDWDLPFVGTAVSITTIYDKIESDSIPDCNLISKAQLFLEQENVIWDSRFIENVLAIKYKGSIADKISERKKSDTIIHNYDEKKLEAEKVDKNDDIFKPCSITEKISQPVPLQDTQSKIPFDNVDTSTNSTNCVRKTGTRRTNRNIFTPDSKTTQIEHSMGKVVSQPILPDKKSLFNQLNQIDFKQVTAIKESILQYIPQEDDYFKSSKEFENSLRGIGNALGLGKWWQEEFAKLQKEGFYLGSETQEELKSIEKFMNTSFKEILKPVCHKEQTNMSVELPTSTKKPIKVFSNMDKKLASHQENDRKRSPLRTKMNTNLMKRSNDKKIMDEKIIANDKKGENVKNARLASVPVIKKAKVLKGQRYSAKFKTNNKLPNGKHSALRNKAKFIEAPYKKCTPFKILRTPVNNYSKATSKNQRVLLKNKPVPCKNTRISLKNKPTPIKNSRKIFKKSRTQFKNQEIAFKKSLSAKDVTFNETIKNF